MKGLLPFFLKATAETIKTGNPKRIAGL